MNGVKRCTDTPKKKARERNHHHTLPEAPYIEICRQRFSEGCKTARTVIGLLSGYLTVKAILNPDAVKAAVHYHQPITAKEPGEEHTEDDGWLHFRGVYFLFCREVSLSFRHSIGDSKVPEQEYEILLYTWGCPERTSTISCNGSASCYFQSILRTNPSSTSRSTTLFVGRCPNKAFQETMVLS
jgi:hypothetical protein